MINLYTPLTFERKYQIYDPYGQVYTAFPPARFILEAFLFQVTEKHWECLYRLSSRGFQNKPNKIETK